MRDIFYFYDRPILSHIIQDWLISIFVLIEVNRVHQATSFQFNYNLKVKVQS